MSGAAQNKKSRSPRAPSMPLDEAIERAGRIYEREHRHLAPVDAVAQSLGYSSAKNGTAVQALASLRYYGLIERPGEGQVQVSKDFEAYTFAPDEKLKRDLRLKWLTSPPIFAELLEKFPGELPSDPTLKFSLIQRGFSPAAADECVAVFRRSVEFARFYEANSEVSAEDILADASFESPATSVPNTAALAPAAQSRQVLQEIQPASGVDRIPVRLAGSRRAWIEIPSPFYEADKDRLKAQIDLLLTDDEVHEEGDEGA